MVNPNDIAQSLKSKSFEIDCIDMVLTQGGQVENPITFKGKGSIRKEADGTLMFKLYSTDVEHADSFRHLRQMSGARPGTLYGESDKYHLKSTA